MILDTDGIVMGVVEDDLGQVLGLDGFPPGHGVDGLHDDHVPTIASLLQQSPHGGVGLEGRTDFDDVATDRD